MANVPYVDSRTGNVLDVSRNCLIDPVSKESFPIVDEIPRFCEPENYSQSFGFQWNIFDKTQLDNYSHSNLSEARFYGETAWNPSELAGLNILEVGSGAGRFTEVFLRTTKAHLYSIDYSNAVEVNWRNNSKYHDRLQLAQASIYAMPFPDDSFDKIFCLGVLQHTPSFKDSVAALVRKAKIGGEIVVDFYPINGWYTKVHSKYIFRPITQRLPKETLLWLIRKNIRWMLVLFDLLCCVRLGVLTRFIPITDVRGFPKTLTPEQRLEWAVMDTFDAFSPEFDNPQRIQDVARMFEDCGCEVTFAGYVNVRVGVCTVVRAKKMT
jgi:SAM-dependent methyltransferase